MDGRSLELRFAALRRRVLLIGSLAATGWMALVVFVLALVAAWFDLLWELSPPVRTGCDVLLVVAGLAALAAGVYRILVRSRWRSLARRLDRTAGSGGEILSGYELSREAFADSKSQPLTRGLAGIAVAQAAALAAGIPAHRVVPLATLRRMGIWLGVAAIAAIGLLILCPGLAETEVLRFGDPYGDHPPYSNIVFHVEPGNTRVLYGGGLDVAVSTEGPPPQRVELVLRDGQGQEEVLPMFQSGPGQWRTVLARVTGDSQYFARARRARSLRYAIEVITVPKLKNVRFRIAPPDYARRAVYEGAMPEGGIAGLAGTQVQVFAESNRPLSHGTLTLAAAGKEQRIQLEPVKGTPETVSGSFEIRTPGRFDVSVTDVAEHDSREKFSGSVAMLPDEKPLIRILQPPAMAYATPSAVLPVVASGEDDCGIATMALFRSLNDTRALPVDLDVPRPSPTRFDGQQALPLLAYGLDPGDVIKLFARVEDNDPSGVKGAETPIVTVQIISQEDFERMQQMREGLEALLSKYRQADRRLESLAAESERLQKEIEKQGGEMTDQQRQALEKLSEQMAEDARELREAAEHTLPFDLDDKLTRQLKDMAESLDEAADEMKQGDPSKLSGPEALKLLKALDKKLGQRKQQFDSEAMQPLEHLEKVFPLIEDQSRFLELYQHQRDLAQRMASLKGQDENNSSAVKARMRNLEDEQNRLREELNSLLDDIETHVTQLPDDPRLDKLRETAEKFAKELRSSSADEAMNEAESGLAKFSGSEGHAGAKRAGDILEQFLAKCKACQGQGRGVCALKFAPILERELSNTIDQLLGGMGLGEGSGSGQAGQSGYSMRRGGMNNVGLYGRMPGLEQTGGKGKQGDKQSRGLGQKSHAGPDFNPALLSGQDQGAASGGAAEAVPPRYRGRVGAYFKRVADETPSGVMPDMKTILIVAALVVGTAVSLTRLTRADSDVADGQAAGDRTLEPKQTGGEPDSIVQVANLVYAGTKSSQCFADHFLVKAEKETAISTSRRFHAVKLSSDEIYNFPMVIMTGEGAFSLPDQERSNLARYIERGGFLLASAGCSSQEWERSFRKEMAAIFPHNKLEELGMDHPIFHTVYDVHDLAGHHGKPRPLEGIVLGGRLGVLYSRDGLNDTEHTQGCCCCGGNEITNAIEINVNVLAYALTY